MTPDHQALGLEKAFIEVRTDAQGMRHVSGSGMVRPSLMVELHEDYEYIDLMIDLGGEFKYCMKEPELQAGKVFAPDVSSLLRFSPTRPWEQISQEDYRSLSDRLNFLS
jgi:hypothetical protein